MERLNHLSDNPNLVESRHIAMLIDGDNAQPSLIGEMLAEASRHGLVTIRRIYGDWTEATMKSWKETLQIHAIQPIQQFRNTIGKNATDSAMIIDAMDILYTSGVNGFCLVSSDSDYTRLAIRIREKSLFVMGIGKQQTPLAFVNACIDGFVYEENLRPPESSLQSKSKTEPEIKAQTKSGTEPEAKAQTKAEAELQQATKPKKISKTVKTLFKRAFDLTAQDDDGWASLAELGSRLKQLDPSFDPRTYGYQRLSLLVKGHPEIFETKEGSPHLSLKVK